MSELADNPALAFKARVAEDGTPAETVFVRHRIHKGRVMRANAVDEGRGRWVCCAYEVMPGTWQHDLILPADLEIVERRPRG